MVELNLLPWREAQSAYEAKRTILYVLLCLCVLIFLFLVADYFLQQSIHSITQHIQQLQQQLARQNQVDAQHHNERVYEFQRQGEAYQKNNLRFFENIAHVGELNFCLIELAKEQDSVRVEGRAQSLLDITSLVEKWQSTGSFAYLRAVQAAHVGENHYAFRLEGVANAQPWSN